MVLFMAHERSTLATSWQKYRGGRGPGASVFSPMDGLNGGQASFTIILPMLSPLNSPMKASGAFRMPSRIVSRQTI